MSISSSITWLNLRLIRSSSSGNRRAANRTGAVASPSCRSAAAGLPGQSINQSFNEPNILPNHSINPVQEINESKKGQSIYQPL